MNSPPHSHSMRKRINRKQMSMKKAPMNDDTHTHVQMNNTTNMTNALKQGRLAKWPNWSDSTSLSRTWVLSNIPYNDYVNCCCWWVCCFLFFHFVWPFKVMWNIFRRRSSYFLMCRPHKIRMLSFFCLLNNALGLCKTNMIETRTNAMESIEQKHTGENMKEKTHHLFSVRPIRWWWFSYSVQTSYVYVYDSSTPSYSYADSRVPFH